MSYALAVAFFLGISILFYLLFGGADFGAGVLELFLGKKSKKTIYKAIAPVWEANHMWLIIAVVILFNGFPKIYSLLSTALHIPVMMVLIGIVMRGTAFTFRHYDAVEDGSQKIYTNVFRYSSAFSVFSLGLVIGPLLAATIPPEIGLSFSSYYVDPWFNGFSISTGLFLMTISSYIASIYLLGEVNSKSDYHRLKTIMKTVLILSIVTGCSIFIFSYLNDYSFHKDFYNHPFSLACVGLSIATIPLIFSYIKNEKIWSMRIAVGLQMTLILAGMLFIQYPFFLKFANGEGLHIIESAAPPTVMKILFWSLMIGLIIIFPALGYLIKVFKTNEK